MPDPLARAGSRDVAAERGSESLPLARIGAVFKRDRRLMLLGLIGALALGAAGLWQLLSHDDEARVYGELGRKINGVRQLCFDAFWKCALEGVDARAVRTNTDLTQWSRTLTEEVGAQDYAAHLRYDCESKLAPITGTLDQLIVPPDLKVEVSNLQNAGKQLQQHVADWIGCLEQGDTTCDASAAEPHLDAIARSWFDFQHAHAAINRTLRLRLEKR